MGRVRYRPPAAYLGQPGLDDAGDVHSLRLSGPVAQSSLDCGLPLPNGLGRTLSPFCRMPQLASSDEHELEGHLVQHVAFSAGLRSRGDEERICVAARIVRAKGEEARRHPYLLFLQGGPGFESPRRVSPWIAEACKSYQVRRQRGLPAAARKPLPAARR